MATASLSQSQFDVSVGSRTPELLLPQRMGRMLWAPMLLMAVMAFPIAAVLGIVRAIGVADGDAANTLAVLGQVTPGVMFIGFTAVFSAIVFTIARILGALRRGGGEVQEAVGGQVVTPRMPATAKFMIALMAMAMMALVFAVIVHFVLAARASGADAATLDSVKSWATWIEGLRRFSVAVYLSSIALGLATIVTVLRFQSQRILELAREKSAA